MKDEAAPGLDRAAVMDRAVGRDARVDLQLAKKAAKGDAGALVADADADGAILVVDAHGDHGAFEARVGHSWHRQQQLAGKEVGLLDHRNDHGTLPRDGQDLRALSGEPICRFA
jgi:hypothetical protein